jgi:DNA-binding beta-propeller fold protein YncE
MWPLDGVLRTVAVCGPPFAMAVDARTSRLFVITTTGPSGSFAVLDTRTGALIRTGPTIRSPQAIAVDEATNRAFILSLMATVHVLNAQTGEVMHVGTTHLAAYTVAVAWRSHHIFVDGADEVGVVAVLDARTGALLHTIGGPPRNDVGGGPMAVDNQTGHVFALGDRRVTILDAGSGRVVGAVAVMRRHP